MERRWYQDSEMKAPLSIKDLVAKCNYIVNNGEQNGMLLYNYVQRE